MVTGQNGIGQNRTDEMVATFIDSNSIEFLFSNHRSQITQVTEHDIYGIKRVNVESNLLN